MRYLNNVSSRNINILDLFYKMRKMGDIILQENNSYGQQK